MEQEVQPADLSSEQDVQGVTMKQMITEKDGAPVFSLRVFHLEPGGYTPFHSHSWEHEVYVFDGSGTVVGEGQILPIKKGCSLFVLPGEKHRFKAGKKGMSFVCCVPHQIKGP
jgi:quercetin dioxygenase-like cupin family protein